ncbi:MAG: DUF401 family protein [Pseudomonadota bacterium]
MALNRFLPMFASLMIGSIMIGLWMGLDLPSVVTAMWGEFTSPTSLWLSCIIVLILFLSHLLTKSKRMDRIFESFAAVSPSSRFTTAAMPALIGLLPMPGGALFSAPMVETALKDSSVKPELKVAVNYWFRHIWEYWWPLYPGVILAISVFAVEPWKMIVCQFPLTLGALAAGWVFILRAVPNSAEEHKNVDRSTVLRFVLDTMPIWIVVAGLFVIRVVLESVGFLAGYQIPGVDYLSFLLALILAIWLVIRTSSESGAAIREALSDPKSYYIAFTIAAVLGFKGVLVDSHAIEQVKLDLAAYNVPPLLIMIFLPFLAGMITGIAVGFVGASFPLVVTLVPEGASPYPYALLAYGFGYAGMMLSPIHICFVVTKEYFSANLGASFIHLWKPSLVVLLWTVALFLIYVRLAAL